MTPIRWFAVAIVLLSSQAPAQDASSGGAPSDIQLEDPENPMALIKTSLGEITIELFAKEAPRTVENFLGLAEGTKEFTDLRTGEKAKRPYFDGLVFHRVIKDFMLQGGCPLGTGTGDPGYKFEDEINASALGLDNLKAMDQGRPHPWLLIRSQEDFDRMVKGPLFHALGIRGQEDLDSRKQEVQERLNALTLKECYENLGYKYSAELKSHPPKRGVIAMANSGPNTNGSQFFINLVDTDWLTGKHTVFGRVVRGMDIVDKIGAVETGPGDRPVEPVKILSIRRVKP